MTFAESFHAWLDSSLSADIPDAVVAFSFNLYEESFVEGAKFGVELIGSNHFDATNSDWACEEIWQPSVRSIHVPVVFSGEYWEGALDAVQRLIQAKLASGDQASSAPTSRQGIGVGFVDGELNVLWSRNK